MIMRQILVLCAKCVRREKQKEMRTTQQNFLPSSSSLHSVTSLGREVSGMKRNRDGFTVKHVKRADVNEMMERERIERRMERIERRMERTEERIEKMKW